MAETKEYVNDCKWAITTLSLLLFVGVAIDSERRLLSSDIRSAEAYLVGHHTLSLRVKDVRLSSSNAADRIEFDPSAWGYAAQRAGDAGLLEWLGPEMDSGRLPLTQIAFLTTISGLGEVRLVIGTGVPEESLFDAIRSSNTDNNVDVSKGYEFQIWATDANGKDRRQMLNQSIEFRATNKKVLWKDGLFVAGRGEPEILLPASGGGDTRLPKAELLPRLVATALRWGVTSDNTTQAYYQLRSRYESQRTRLPLVQTDVVATYALVILAGLAVGAGAWLSLMLALLKDIEPGKISEHWTVLDALSKARNAAGIRRALHLTHSAVFGLFYLMAFLSPVGITMLAWAERVEGNPLLSAACLVFAVLGLIFSASALSSGAFIVGKAYQVAMPALPQAEEKFPRPPECETE